MGWPLKVVPNKGIAIHSDIFLDFFVFQRDNKNCSLMSFGILGKSNPGSQVNIIKQVSHAALTINFARADSSGIPKIFKISVK